MVSRRGRNRVGGIYTVSGNIYGCVRRVEGVLVSFGDVGEYYTRSSLVLNYRMTVNNL